MDAEQTVAITLSNGGTTLIDRTDFERTIEYQHRSGVVLRVCPADYTWRRSTSNKWQYARANIGFAAKDYTVQLHRLVMDAKPGEIIDHINGDRLDNRRANLRRCTNAQNSANMAIRPRGKSQYKGVYFDNSKRRWKAQIGFQNNRIALGYHLTELEAAIAYDAAACQLFLEFANPHFTSTAQIEAARKSYSAVA